MKEKSSYKPLIKICVRMTENIHSCRVFTRKTESAAVRKLPAYPIKFTLISSSHSSCDRHPHLIVQL